MARYASWGNYPSATQRTRTLRWRGDALPLPDDGSSVLPRGLGRSYGDNCLNDGGTLLDTTRLNHLIDFDREAGLLCCEAGVSLDEILQITVPHGWFLPVTPGTKYVTVGGAVANDIHGKNHHGAANDNIDDLGHHDRDDDHEGCSDVGVLQGLLSQGVHLLHRANPPLGSLIGSRAGERGTSIGAVPTPW